MSRFRFCPFWKLTNWGFLRPYAFRIRRGCDEFHNLSRFTIVPLVGEFTLFARGYDVNQPEHIGARFNGVWEGADVPGCAVCIEIKEDV